MYHSIFEIDTQPIKQSRMDAMSIGEHIVFLEKCATVDDEEDRSVALRQFGKWLKTENLGVLKKSAFILNEDAAHGRHFAARYAGFHQLIEALYGLTETDYLHRFNDICNLISDLKKSVVDEDDDYVYLNGEMLLTMDEFLRLAKAGQQYHIGSICKYHQ
ncbi:MAG: hypothetical protein NC203_11145 [Firmicutes bacterium]|nr:hypothetical protein [Bacillota bacterium]